MRTKCYIVTLCIICLSVLSCDRGKKDLARILENPSVEALETFMADYSDHELYAHAEAIRDSLLYSHLVPLNFPDTLEWFIQNYPESHLISEANEELKSLNDEIQYLKKIETQKATEKKIKALQAYLKDFENGRFVRDVQKEIDSLAFGELEIYKRAAARLGKKAMNIEDKIESAKMFEKCALKYIQAANFFHHYSDSTSFLYQRAGYAYHFASFRVMQGAVKSLFSGLSAFANSRQSAASFQAQTEYNTEYYNKQKFFYYEKAIQFYKKAGDSRHADKLESASKISKPDIPVIDNEWK